MSPIRRFGRGGFLLPEPHRKRSPPVASNVEAARLLNAICIASREWFGFFAFLLLTGARRGEAAGRRWEDVDLSRRLVTIRRSYDAPTRSGRTRTVPISSELCQILTEHRIRDRWGGSRVFPHPETGAPLRPDIKLGRILDAACSSLVSLACAFTICGMPTQVFGSWPGAASPTCSGISTTRPQF